MLKNTLTMAIRRKVLFLPDRSIIEVRTEERNKLLADYFIV